MSALTSNPRYGAIPSPIKNLAWSSDELAALRVGSKAGQTPEQVGATIGRTGAACVTRARKMGWDFAHKPREAAHEPWPYEDPDDLKAKDAAYVRRVLKANVYGFGKTILVDVAALRGGYG